jgi:hypothetical protein
MKSPIKHTNEARNSASPHAGSQASCGLSKHLSRMRSLSWRRCFSFWPAATWLACGERLILVQVLVWSEERVSRFCGGNQLGSKDALFVVDTLMHSVAHPYSTHTQTHTHTHTRPLLPDRRVVWFFLLRLRVQHFTHAYCIRCCGKAELTACSWSWTESPCTAEHTSSCHANTCFLIVLFFIECGGLRQSRGISECIDLAGRCGISGCTHRYGHASVGIG